jgi:LmbE family N-acetylglucosaminyl deacetylase
MRVLVVAAHPDDEVLGCGATLARLGHTEETHIAILGEGLTSRRSPEDQPVAPLSTLALQENARAAAALLGASSVRFMGLPDNRFDELPLLNIVQRLEAIIEDLRPETIYTHHPGDLNIDHGLAFRAVLTATRPIARCPVQDIFAFEVASSTEWAFQQLYPVFKPNVFVDVTETIEAKIRAITLYTGEVRTFPHPRSAEALRAQARRWGATVGLGYAEAFELVRSIRR